MHGCALLQHPLDLGHLSSGEDLCLPCREAQDFPCSLLNPGHSSHLTFPSKLGKRRQQLPRYREKGIRLILNKGV